MNDLEKVVLFFIVGIPAALFIVYIAAKLVGYGYQRGRQIFLKEQERDDDAKSKRKA